MRILTSLLFLLVFSTSVAAQCQGPNLFDALPEADRLKLQEEARQQPFSEGLLWRVEKGGVVSYVVGTLHIFLPEHAEMVERLQRLSPAPEQLFLELTSAAQADFQSHLMQNPDLYLIQTGPSLIDRLGDDLWEEVASQLQDRGMPAFMAARYQPWFLGMTLMLPPCALEILKFGQKGLDFQIEDMAHARGMPTYSLDTTDSLLAILAGDPLDKQVEDLRWGLSLQTTNSAAEQTPTLIDMYRDQTVQLIWDFGQYQTAKLTQGDADARRVAALLQDLEDDLIIRRNTDWVRQLVPELTQTSSLVAFGALHLTGEHGVLAQLRAAGFTITRLPL